MSKLYLDNIRTPKTEGWDIVRSYGDFVKWIEVNGLPDKVSFDHDLGMEHTKYSFDNGSHDNQHSLQESEFHAKTGYDAAKWLCQYCWINGLPIPSWNVHSANPVGRDNIKQLIQNFEKRLNY